MKIGFVSLYGPGHFNPMSALARQLQSRNHDVVMLSLPFVEPLARAANLPFIRFGEKEFSDDPWKKGVPIVNTIGFGWRRGGSEESFINEPLIR
jgi:UDP:flavonoid glycosyltransferase YjiC (YdhE family)